MSTEGRTDYSISVGVSEILTLSFIQLHPEKNTGDLHELPFLKPRIWSSLNTCSQNEWMMMREHKLLREAHIQESTESSQTQLSFIHSTSIWSVSRMCLVTVRGDLDRGR